jgi:hypothetical protein
MGFPGYLLILFCRLSVNEWVGVNVKFLGIFRVHGALCLGIVAVGLSASTLPNLLEMELGKGRTAFFGLAHRPRGSQTSLSQIWFAFST